MMMTLKKGLALTAVALALPLAAISTANALPATSALALSTPMANAANAGQNITQVQYRGRRGYYRGGGGRYYGGGAGLGLGLAAGALLGGAIAAGSNPYYGPGYGYGPGYAPGYAVAPAYGGGDAEAYCMQRYRSYDPASGTYLNNDGNRYPCP